MVHDLLAGGNPEPPSIRIEFIHPLPLPVQDALMQLVFPPHAPKRITMIGAQGMEDRKNCENTQKIVLFADY